EGALAERGADLIALGEEEAGDGMLDEAISVASEAVEFVVPALRARVELLLRTGHLGAALETARRAAQAANEYRVLALHLRQQEGEALLALGRATQGQALLREVLAGARAIGAAPPCWDAALSLATHLAAEGRAENAAAARAEAFDLLTRAAVDLPDDLRQSFAATRMMRRAREVKPPGS